MIRHKGTITVQYNQFEIDIEDVAFELWTNKRGLQVTLEENLLNKLKQQLKKGHVQWEDISFKERDLELPSKENELKLIACVVSNIWNDRLPGWEEYDLYLKLENNTWRII